MATKKKRRGGMKRGHARTVSERIRQVMTRIKSVSIDGPQVMDFGDPTLREAFRLWWHPYNMGPDFDELTGQAGQVIRARRTRGGGHGTIRRIPAKHPVMRGDMIERRKLDPGYYRRIERAMRSMRAVSRRTGKPVKLFRKRDLRDRPSNRRSPVRVLILLNYPLSEPQRKVVTVDRRYPGEVFALAHDFYRELYAEDEKSGGKAGPMNDGKGPILNRGRGPLVWGHDLGDLAFESCWYRKFSAADAKKYGAEGEFTFGIGS